MEIKKEIKNKPLVWKAAEWNHYEKEREWGIALIIIAVAFVVFGILIKNYLFSMLVLLAAFVIYVYAHKHPRILEFSITERGILIDSKLYPYKEIQSFWILHELPELNDLVIKIDSVFLSHIKIPLGDSHPQEVREYLLDFLPEEEYEEPLVDILARWIRF